MNAVEQIRTFVAIELTDDLLKSLSRLQERLERQTPHGAVRWVRPEGVHLTLKFLGDVPTTRVPRIAEAVASACRGGAPFSFDVAGLGCFPNPSRPRVLWVGVEEPTGALARLHKALERELAGIGFAPERRPFKPHLTLGRVRRKVNRSDRGRLGALVAESDVGRLGGMTVASVSLIRSDLRPTGAVYTELARATLQK
jgi:2'-5' RNA ligase